MAKKIYTGFDQDTTVIRGARLSVEPPKGRSGRPIWKLLAAEEVMGDFFDDDRLTASLKRLKTRLNVQAGDRISTCLSGKQTYAIQLDVKRLPPEEMDGMLKLELRKSMPFESSVATFDYQFLPGSQSHSKDGGVPVIVSAAANSYLSRHVEAYDRAGLPPNHVDVLPVSIANAFWAAQPYADGTHVVLHAGSAVCTLVIDGGKSPFFNRSFSFNIGDVVSGAKNLGVDEMLLQMNVMASEITKSITYYRNTYQCSDITTITVMGCHATHEAFRALGRKMGYEVQTIQTLQQVHAVKPPEAGKYDLAIALAMQAAAEDDDSDNGGKK